MFLETEKQTIRREQYAHENSVKHIQVVKGKNGGICAKHTSLMRATDIDASEIPDALTILNTVWASYSEDEKFPAAGGDYSEENMTDGKPGKVSLEKPSEIEYLLTLPASVIEEADDAASLFHMMNGNTFTCGALRLTDAGKLDEAAKEIRDYIMAKQWMCGFPDKLIVVSVDNYLISCFGAEDLVNTFRDKLLAVDSSFTAAYDEAIDA